MKVKTWIRRYVCSDWIDDEKLERFDVTTDLEAYNA